VGAVLAEQPDRVIRDIHQWVTKYVATSTPLDQDWANTTVIDGGLVEFVRDLKQQPGVVTRSIRRNRNGVPFKA
jgi:hypothetical protein